ncbi:sugar kinase [Bradyrhizobium sp. LTSP885]|uniref:tagatose kinase n=1 Tax=Bradyrhizobium sp. LTSP885 TaxID=1619232 RepID=UPI0005CA27D6|nr:sugar kinase [Bradyrhizobium sp. LTSP885]KJC50497.1 sugar kinase [Bradyrhizobium sp. LTSP885]
MLVTIGEILVEIMATTIGIGFHEAQPLIGPFPSGAPAIFIDQVAKLGVPCGMVGAVGDDDFGRLNIERLAGDGVDVSAISIQPDIATGSAFVRYREDGSRDFVYNILRSANSRIELSAAAERLIASADHLHVMGSTLSIPAVQTITETAVARVKARGGTISFDPNVRKEMLGDASLGDVLRRILAVTDIFMPSGDEIFLFAPADDPAQAAQRLIAGGVAELVLKRGAAGAQVFTVAGCVDGAPFSVNEVDPTGAGDCFGATFVVCRRLGMTADRALAYANAAGARTVTVMGPMEGASTFAELDTLIAERSQRA